MANSFQASSGSHDYFIAFVPSANVKVGDVLTYTRKGDGRTVEGTCAAVLGVRDGGRDVVFAKAAREKARTKAEIEAENAALRAQLAAASAQKAA